ncbi:hypothetical protein BN8_03701 [Fibrisoma limi BUZ 3]|uniref:Uncharacterized protein n=1 Tax=Fibrisoma limi BUZ 3 TaxID=1185876 RepID=I2GKU5_9BACT|nr:hypothetical protein BN8_03701 [Fibrisoma limi BUZ 3]
MAKKRDDQTGRNSKKGQVMIKEEKERPRTNTNRTEFRYKDSKSDDKKNSNKE